MCGLAQPMKSITSLWKLEFFWWYFDGGEIKISIMLIVMVEWLGILCILKVQYSTLKMSRNNEEEYNYEESEWCWGKRHDMTVDVVFKFGNLT